MQKANPPMKERSVLSFSTESLNAREELLFKSFVRLLSYRTQHIWLYTARPLQSQEEFKVDLRVVPDSLDTRRISLTQCVLILGTVDYPRRDYLRLPLRPEELEIALNQQGNRIMNARAAAASVSVAGANDVAATAVTRVTTATAVTAVTDSEPVAVKPEAAVDAPISPSEVICLLRWPPAGVLRSTDHLRLATVMLGQRLSLADIQRRSGQPAKVCLGFIADLRRVGYLEMPSATIPTSTPPMTDKVKPPPKVQTGLLARIRSRFGFQANGHV